MAINFCSATTLLPKLCNHIRNEMSWENGGMNLILKYKLPKCKIALNFQKRRLVCWAIISLFGWEKNNRPFVGSWTLEDERRKGYAIETIKALLEHISFSSTQEINVYRISMYQIMHKIGYNPIFQNWNEDKQNKWFQGRCWNLLASEVTIGRQLNW